ncbi:MAG TPA: MOSC domain-containing protein [Pirellulaceae bacterium]|nr:MOSC domain-containing protein [Pirellulaceae bacterium]HMO94029.1 MOSC domain-containing protein [Pirellulaceae bacterium]HMP70790.1 MOSC domain-containing protein [Pirellulaceae bacterium]
MTIKEMKQQFVRTGKVEWIGVRTAQDMPVQVVDVVVADTQHGLIGDRFKGGPGALRQVTLIQAENLQVVAQLLGQESLDPALTRRNIMISGINLSALKDCLVRIGGATLKITGSCPPCSQMEKNLGKGGYNAMIGHGGVTATVLEGGEIRLGDELIPIFETS